MKSTSQTTLQLQLDFLSPHRGNLHSQEKSDLEDLEPLTTSPHLSIHLYKSSKIKARSRILRDQVNTENHINQGVQANIFESRDLSKSLNDYLHQYHEICMKLNLAKQLVDWMIQDGLSLDELSEKTHLSIDKLNAILHGNAKKVQFYELLVALTKFGYQAQICFRRTQHQFPGSIELEWQ